MADSTRVQPDALLAFGVELAALAGTHQSAAQTAELSTLSARMGTSGMQEAVWAAGSHQAARQAAAQFAADTIDGLQALQYVAATVAERYRHADADQAQQLAAVHDAFTPPPGTPTTASRRAEAAAAAAEQAAADADATAAAESAQSLLYERLGERPADIGDQPLLDPAASTGHPGATRPTGASTVGRDAPSTQYLRYIDQVMTHRAFVSGGQGGATAEDEYDPRAEYEAAVRRAERQSEEDRIPYVVQVDDHGTSEVVQADPDDIPYVAPLDYTEVDSPAPSPAVLSYGD